MKKDLLIKILKYTGVALIGAFVGIGALVGVSCCSQRQEKTTTILNQTKRGRVISGNSINDIIGSNKTFYAQLKHYDNPNGFLYQDSINLTNSRIMSQHQLALRIKGDIITGNARTPVVLAITTALNSGVYKLSSIRYYTADEVNVLIYYAYADGGVYNRSNCAFVFTNARYEMDNVDTHALSYLDTLFDVYELSDTAFKFSEHINYYAPYGQDIDSYYVNDPSMVNPSDYVLKTLLEGYPFYSGGMVFDTIRLRYINAMATSYLDENGNRKVWMNSGFANFMFVEYVNTATNYILVVNDRIRSPWQDGNQSGFNQTKNSKWLSEYYRDIQFFIEPSQIVITKLSTLNNSSYDGGYIDNNINNNVGLSNAFSLLSMAFTSWLPILNVTIVPGITLGLLLFLPLIVGIIILVVWVVKR